MQFNLGNECNFGFVNTYIREETPLLGAGYSLLGPIVALSSWRLVALSWVAGPLLSLLAWAPACCMVGSVGVLLAGCLLVVAGQECLRGLVLAFGLRAVLPEFGLLWGFVLRCFEGPAWIARTEFAVIGIFWLLWASEFWDFGVGGGIVLGVPPFCPRHR